MPRPRRNEWNFAAQMAALITQLLNEPEFLGSPLGHAEAERTETKGAKRLDLVIFARTQRETPLVTGELKVPWSAEGRTPYNRELVTDAHSKASRAGAIYFLTWNIRRVVVWKTDDPGVALERRVVYDNELTTAPLRSEADLDRSDIVSTVSKGVRELLQMLSSFLLNAALASFLPLDRLFIATLEAALYHPIEITNRAIASARKINSTFRRELERWMREDQGWVVATATEEENEERAARFSCYVLVNRLCFYNALRRKYASLPRLQVPNSLITAAMLERRLDRAFAQAKKLTGDYETVFDGDFGDRLPLLADEAVEEWRRLIRTLDYYDFASISVDIIGSMYEQLIRPEERHRYGQHYTQPLVVDLINAFAIPHDPALVILDPACGGGTFLVRAYARKRSLNPELEHSDLLASLYGCDILSYACHLSTINLAIRDLIDDDNFPRIRHGDFLRFKPGQAFTEQPERLQAGGIVINKIPLEVNQGHFDAIVGNPPYISARVLPSDERNYYYQTTQKAWPAYQWRSRSDIYVYFWTHSAQFLTSNGTMAFLTQSAWLDTDYGFPLQEWMLENFKIEAILESEAEPWFTDARVATAITVLRREPKRLNREQGIVRFVQFRTLLRTLFGDDSDETVRQRSVSEFCQRLMLKSEDEETPEFRLRIIAQRELWRAGVGPSGRYVGSKWGHYLRATTGLYALLKNHRRKFLPLQDLADIRRGITTNCDDFFIVKDVSVDALTDVVGDRTFRDKYRVARRDVVDGKIRIIRRKDGYETALERDLLRPIIKSGRDAEYLSTKRNGTDEYIVVLRVSRDRLSRLSNAYVEAGEREGWHKQPSFQGLHGSETGWYSLQEPEASPILFIKTMQYSPMVLWNDGGYLANQRLYQVMPLSGVDSAALCAVLNSTIFASTRYASVKALGREAAIDQEVFAVQALLTPDLRRLSTREVEELSGALKSICQRKVLPLLEEALQSAGLSEARTYVAQHPVSREAWPSELRDEARQVIDRIVLKYLGLSDRAVQRILEHLYNDLVEHIRKLRLLELEAQRNRGGGVPESTSVRQLADEVWAQILSEEKLEMKNLPSDFIKGISEVLSFRIPLARKYFALEPGLFDDRPSFGMRAGKSVVELNNREQMLFLLFLADRGASGDVKVPVDRRLTNEALQSMEEYWEKISRRITAIAKEITGRKELQDRIVHESLRKIVNR